MIVVAFHTPEYADCAAPFRAAVEALGLECQVLPMRSRGAWAANAGLKPLAIQIARSRLRGPLLYLDIDCELLKVPEIPAGTWDLATCENPVRSHVNRIATAALWIGDTPSAYLFLERWREQVRKARSQDHPAFTTCLRDCGDWLARADATELLRGSWRFNAFRPERTQVPA